MTQLEELVGLRWTQTPNNTPDQLAADQEAIAAAAQAQAVADAAAAAAAANALLAEQAAAAQAAADLAIAAANAQGIPAAPPLNGPGVAPLNPGGLMIRRRLLSTLRDQLPPVSLTSLLPSLDTSVLSTFALRGVHADEVFAYASNDPHRTRHPSLHLNGSLDLSSAPFSQFGLSGAVEFDFYAWPFFGGKMFGVPIPSAYHHLHLFAQYPLNLHFGAGVELQRVFVQVQTRLDLITSGRLRPSLSPVVFTVGGTMAFDVPNQAEPLLLQASVTKVEGAPGLILNAGLSRWNEPFGLSGVVLESLWVKSALGTATPDLRLVARWSVGSDTHFALEGFKFGSSMALGVWAGNLTFRQIGDVFRKVVGGSPPAWEDNIEFREVFVGLANEPTMLLGKQLVKGITFDATLNIYALENVQVRLQFGSAGLTVFGKVPQVPEQYLVSGMTLTDLTLQLHLPSSSKGSTATKGPSVYVAGGLSYKGLHFRAALFLSSKRQLLIGEIAGPTLSQFLPFVENGAPWDLKLEKVLLAFSPQTELAYPIEPLVREQFPMVYATPNAKGLLISAEITVPYLDTIMGVSGVKAILAASLSSAEQRLTSEQSGADTSGSGAGEREEGRARRCLYLYRLTHFALVFCFAVCAALLVW
jgi:hypothetical protein